MTTFSYFYRYPTPRNDYRGFVVLTNRNVISKSITQLQNKKSICVVFGRPNKNWAKSTNDLAKVKTFNNIVQK